jgi:phage terminase large subunit-like protein
MAKKLIDEIPFCPHTPWGKQKLFLELTCKEALYGGAAAGGKSEALLMGALQFVLVPGYSALIVRKDTQRLRLAGGLIMRSHEWLTDSDAQWNGRDLQWTFPTKKEPATISFGYLSKQTDRYRYGSSEYQYIAFDELTEFLEDDYLFLFSRLRRRKSIDVPLRMRSASNPGGEGHEWVMRRFISDEAMRMAVDPDCTQGVFWKNGIAYLPARIRDNPAIDENEYRESLLHLPPVDRERLLNGDWLVREKTLIRPESLMRYAQCDHRLELLDAQGRPFAQIDDRECQRFVTIDPAGTGADVARERSGRQSSWTVLQVWDQPPRKHAGYLLLRHVIREKVMFDELIERIEQCHREWKPITMYIENEKLGQAAVSLCKGSLPLEEVSHESNDKVIRAGRLFAKLSRGEIRLPADPKPWLADLESEWLRWTGHPSEVCDQVDAAAYAAIVAEEIRGRVIRMPK